MRLWKIGYIALGIILLVSMLATGSYGLSDINVNIYEEAIDLNEEIQSLGFDNLSLKDYKVRFYNGRYDYVIKEDNIEKESAALDVFVGTTMKIDGEYQVLIPTYELFRELLSTMDTVGSIGEGTIGATEETYSENSHVATIWHEAFHAWQITKWETEIDELVSNMNISEDDSREDIIVKEIDSNSKLVVLFKEEMTLLKRAYEEDDMSVKISNIERALDISKERVELISNQAMSMEYYLENLEGSAMYVEGQVYKLLEGNEAWIKNYMDEFEYQNGSGKYYEMGMLKCELLDQISPNWQSDFSISNGLDELLENAILNYKEIV